jgi:ethanolamine utilization protein EutP
MRRAMIIGAIGAGKSSLINALFKEGQPARKTQTLEYHDWIIDTPGEYSENPMYYRTLMATALEAGKVVMVQDATRDRSYFPPGFSQGFPVPPIGVITKIDHPNANIERAILFLRESLPHGEILLTSSASKKGIEELRAKLIEETQ